MPDLGSTNVALNVLKPNSLGCLKVRVKGDRWEHWVWGYECLPGRRGIIVVSHGPPPPFSNPYVKTDLGGLPTSFCKLCRSCLPRPASLLLTPALCIGQADLRGAPLGMKPAGDLNPQPRSSFSTAFASFSLTHLEEQVWGENVTLTCFVSLQLTFFFCNFFLNEEKPKLLHTGSYLSDCHCEAPVRPPGELLGRGVGGLPSLPSCIHGRRV